MEIARSPFPVADERYLVDNSLHISLYNKCFKLTTTIDGNATITEYNSENAYSDMMEYLASISTTHVDVVILSRIDQPHKLWEISNIRTCKNIVINDLPLNNRMLKFLKSLPLDSLMVVCNDRKIGENWMFHDNNKVLPRKLKMKKFFESLTMFETFLHYQNEKSDATVDVENIKKLLDMVRTERADHPETHAFQDALVKFNNGISEIRNIDNNMRVFYGTSKSQYYQKIIRKLRETPNETNNFENPQQFLHTLFVSDIANPELFLESGIRQVENLVIDGSYTNQAEQIKLLHNVKYKKLFLMDVFEWNYDINILNTVEQLHAGGGFMPSAYFRQLRCQSLILNDLFRVEPRYLAEMFQYFINRGTTIFQNDNPIMLAFSINEWKDVVDAILPVIENQEMKPVEVFRNFDETYPEILNYGMFIKMFKYPEADNRHEFEVGHLILAENTFMFYSLERQKPITKETMKAVVHECYDMAMNHDTISDHISKIPEVDNEWVAHPTRTCRVKEKRAIEPSARKTKTIRQN